MYSEKQTLFVIQLNLYAYRYFRFKFVFLENVYSMFFSAIKGSPRNSALLRIKIFTDNIACFLNTYINDIPIALFIILVYVHTNEWTIIISH